MAWLVGLVSVTSACPPLVLRQEVGAEASWLRGDLPTVWAAGTLWWLDATGLRSTPSPSRPGTPIGRLADQVVWGELRDDLSSYRLVDHRHPFAPVDWRAVGRGALVRSVDGDHRPRAHHVKPDGSVAELAMPTVPNGAIGLSEWMAEGCSRALPIAPREGTTELLAASCTLPSTAFLVPLEGAATRLAPLPAGKEVVRVAGADRLAAVVQEQAEVGTTAWLAWGTPAEWTIDSVPIAQDQVLDLVVVDGERYTLARVAGRYLLRCEQEEVRTPGTVGAAPLHGSQAWGLATLVNRNGSWWIASTREPSGPAPLQR